VLFSTPLLKTINLSIAVLLIALLGAIYWFVWRPLPEVSGEIVAPVHGAATITRDARGVPHIQASSWEDAIFLEGYVLAQDRLWQMDAVRRLAGGELAEVAGPPAVEGDREARRLRMARIAERQELNMTPATRPILAAFARGVNYYIDTHRGRLPIEFTLLGYEPRPWKMRDTLLAALEIHRQLSNSWRDDIGKFRMLQNGNAEKVAYLFPPRTGGEVQPGSNAWAVSGAHTASGKPILANDPHLAWGMPSTWYQVQLTAPDLNVEGFTLPGVPAVIIGHNQNIAWGMTNLGFDVQDLYRIEINAQTGQYRYLGGNEQATVERDVIRVKGAAPVDQINYVTRYGPLFLNEGTETFALRWAAATDEPFDFAILDLNRARNWEEFNKALARFAGPAQNFVYADTAGNIGYHAAGHVPVRKNCLGDVPVDGESGACVWDGWIPYDDLPQSYNPPSGMIVTANQNPFPEDYKYPVNGKFGAKYRSLQIRTLLTSHEKWEPEQMLGVQKDVYSAFLHFVAGQIVKAWEKHPSPKEQLKDAVDLLKSWDGQMEKGTAAPMVATLVDEDFRRAIASKAAPMHAGEWETYFQAPEVVERMLRERPAGWFKDYDQQLIDSLAAGIAVGERSQGSKISRWDYGQWIILRIPQPVLGQVPLVGKYLNVGPVAMSGGRTTIKQTTQRLGPSMRMIADLSDLDRSLANITIGESDNLFSGHYKDQWSSYYGGRSFPMQFGKVDAKDVLTIKPGQ
jgi:penicillin amidase